MILLDTSGLLAALDSGSRRHRRANDVVASAEPPLLLSPSVLAELDTLDERHFRALRTPRGWPFRLLPADG